MSRRCKPGIRARVIATRNVGKIVMVLRPYFGEEVEGATWPEPLFPWVVLSLGGPLAAVKWHTGEDAGPHRMIVVDDCDLEPLDDDDEGDSTERDVDRPIESSVSNKGVPAPVAAGDSDG